MNYSRTLTLTLTPRGAYDSFQAGVVDIAGSYSIIHRRRGEINVVATYETGDMLRAAMDVLAWQAGAEWELQWVKFVRIVTDL